MPVHALALVLAAAAAHALWNVLLAGRPHVQAATAIALLAGSVAFAPVVALTWRVEAEAWPWIGLSALVEVGYFIVLTWAYKRFELSLVYPVARGVAPVLVLGIGTAFLAVPASAQQVVGVVVVSAGVLLVRRGGRGDLAGVGIGLVIALSIAVLTLIDREGITHAAPIPFFYLAMLPVAVASAVLRRRELRAAVEWRSLAVGGFMYGGYALFLYGLRLTEPHAAQAVRESSIVMTTILAALVLKEGVTRRRAAGVLVVLAGVITIALS